MKMRIAEFAVALVIMVSVNVVAHQGAIEALVMLAILSALAQTQILDELEERRAKRMPPGATWSEWLLRLPMVIQLSWGSYSLVHRSYSAAAGCLLLLLYPGWRRVFRKRFPWVPGNTFRR